MDFNNLDPHVRCFALVGQFLHAWSKMEGSLHTAIGSALTIEPTKLHIIIANLGFRDKVNIINTFVGVNPHFCNEDKKAYKKKFRALADYSRRSRNMIAHVPFQVDAEKTGVQFDKVQASGTFNAASEIWDITRFQTEIAKVNEFRALIEQVGNRFAAQPLPEQAYTTAAAQRANY